MFLFKLTDAVNGNEFSVENKNVNNKNENLVKRDVVVDDKKWKKFKILVIHYCEGCFDLKSTVKKIP